MNDIKIFENEEFGQVRVVEVDDRPYFVASDVCKALGLSNPTMAVSRLDDDERAKFNLGVHDNDGTNCINEYGLYNLVLASRKKEAKDFKRWITHEVLPSIRKNGGYIAEQDSLSDDELIAKALIVARKKIEERDHIISGQKEKIKELHPKALFADAVAGSQTNILIGDLAKMLRQNGVEIGQNRLFEWMRSNGYLVKQKGSSYNMPTQRSMERGWFEIKESAIAHSDGHISINKTAKLTGKGQVYFVGLFMKKEEEKKGNKIC